ncbi:site-specific DNA-methyltransferase, partial [candidate division KSB1 bacterium]|nr:site-specific DNA-methyltransferase [candidate division KSB1 bacterium]
LSRFDVDEFLKEMHQVAQESFRVLKGGHYCAVLIGDLRKNKRVVPLGFMLMRAYLRAGFILKEIIIKEQHNCQTTDEWREKSLKYNFLLLAHEYLPVFEKV